MTLIKTVWIKTFTVIYCIFSYIQPSKQGKCHVKSNIFKTYLLWISWFLIIWWPSLSPPQQTPSTIDCSWERYSSFLFSLYVVTAAVVPAVSCRRRLGFVRFYFLLFKFSRSIYLEKQKYMHSPASNCVIRDTIACFFSLCRDSYGVCGRAVVPEMTDSILYLIIVFNNPLHPSLCISSFHGKLINYYMNRHINFIKRRLISQYIWGILD